MKKHDIAKKMKLEAESRYGKGFNHMGLMYVKKKGKDSLNMPKGEKNEGEKHYLGKNEQPVA